MGSEDKRCSQRSCGAPDRAQHEPRAQHPAPPALGNWKPAWKTPHVLPGALLLERPKRKKAKWKTTHIKPGSLQGWVASSLPIASSSSSLSWAGSCCPRALLLSGLSPSSSGMQETLLLLQHHCTQGPRPQPTGQPQIHLKERGKEQEGKEGHYCQVQGMFALQICSSG